MKKSELVLSAATVVVAIVAAVLWRQVGIEREQLAGQRERLTRMEADQAAAAAAREQAAAASITAAPPASAAPAPAPPSGAGPATAQPPATRNLNLAAVLASPEASDMIRAQVRSALAQQFPDLASELGLNPAESEKFMDLLARHASGVTGDALGMLGGGSGAQDSQRRMIEAQLAGEKEIANMLGSKYPAWQEYQGKAAARQEVSQLRSLLGTGPDALTESQSRPLIDAIGAERARMNKEEQNRMSAAARNSANVNLMEEQLKNMPAQNERLVNAASSHLSASQLDRYKRMLAQQESLVRAVLGSMNPGGNTGGQAGAPR